MPPVKHYSSSEVNQYELSTRLLSLTENNASYTLTQINGQRIYRKAPHAWTGPEPSRNCEVFIGRIPHDCFEDTLVPLFRRAGELFEFRLMINFSGWNRGYAFAMYTTEAEAGNAIRMFNNYMIRPSWQLGVCPSINNCRIFISRIPPTTPSAEIVRLLYALTDEVQEVRIRRSIASCAAIVEYKSHRGAAMARKALVAAAGAAWGCGARPAVDWSLPQSPQLLKQYHEVGRWTAERGVELTRAPEEPPTAAGGGAAPSYTLEPWSQARRLRMIHDAQRAAATATAAAANEWSNRVPNGMDSLISSMGSLQLASGMGEGVEAGDTGERAVWAPMPALKLHNLQGAFSIRWSNRVPNGMDSLISSMGSLQLASGMGGGVEAGDTGERAVWAPMPALKLHNLQGAFSIRWSNRVPNGMDSLISSMGSLQLASGMGGGVEAGDTGERAVWAPMPAVNSHPPPPRDFNPWTARHPLQEFIAITKNE